MPYFLEIEMIHVLYEFCTCTAKTDTLMIFYRSNTNDIENELLTENSNRMKKYNYDKEIPNSEPNDNHASRYIPEFEEMRYSCAIAKKGYIHILSEETETWEKQWIVRDYI